jgi:hypothetical protein
MTSNLYRMLVVCIAAHTLISVARAEGAQSKMALRVSQQITNNFVQLQRGDAKSADAPTSLQLTASQGKADVTLRISKRIENDKLLTAANENWQSTWGLELSTPTQQSSPERTVLSDLDGIADGSTLKFTFGAKRVSGVSLNGIDAELTGTLCEKLLKQYFMKGNDGDMKLLSIKPSLVAQVDDKLTFNQAYAQWVQDSKGVRPKCGTDIFKIYADTKSIDMNATLDALSAEFAAVAKKAVLHTTGLSASIGYLDFTTFDAASLAKSTSREKPKSIGAYYSMHWLSENTKLTLKVDRKQAYKAARTQTRCPAATTSSPVLCATGAFAKPTEVVGNVLSAGVRRMLPDERFALELMVSRDVKNKTSGVRLPLYFLSNASGGLTGGVALAWNSDEKKTTAALFIGAPFDF